jgi:hypothetical protein
MKNIFVLPTSQASRLYLGNNRNFVFGMMQTSIQSRNDDFTNQNTHITNDEEIKEGDYCISKINNKIFKKEKKDIIDDLCNKIILTTDQDLIKDGVQAIDDEFLEWFVQNPSCEFVEVIYEPKNFLDTKQGWEYEIIIPKKNFYCGDKFDYDEQCEFQCDTCVDKKGVDYGYLPKEEPKQVLTEEDIFNQKDIDAVTDYINKEQQKQALIDMMKSDEELGLYDDTEINRIELVCKDCSDSLEDCTCIQDTIDFSRQEIKLEEVFNDDKKENIKKFIDEIKNPSEPNQALKDAAQRYEKYSERFDNDESAIGNPETWGKRVLTEEDIFNQRDIDAVTDYIGKETSKQETLEEALNNYIVKKHTQEECVGFIDGFQLAKEKTIEEVFEWLTTNNYLTDLKETLIENFKKR